MTEPLRNQVIPIRPYSDYFHMIEYFNISDFMQLAASSATPTRSDGLSSEAQSRWFFEEWKAVWVISNVQPKAFSDCLLSKFLSQLFIKQLSTLVHNGIKSSHETNE